MMYVQSPRWKGQFLRFGEGGLYIDPRYRGERLGAFRPAGRSYGCNRGLGQADTTYVPANPTTGTCGAIFNPFNSDCWAAGTQQILSMLNPVIYSQPSPPALLPPPAVTDYGVSMTEAPTVDQAEAATDAAIATQVANNQNLMSDFFSAQAAGGGGSSSTPPPPTTTPTNYWVWIGVAGGVVLVVALASSGKRGRR